MAVVNKIGKVMKRNHALVNFDQERIVRAILRAAKSVGGFEQDYLEGVNDRIFAAGKDDEGIAQFLSDLVVVCLNAEPEHLVANFPPTVEEIQDIVVHVLKSTGFSVIADAYTCYRWGQHWIRQGAITEEQFVGNGYPPQYEAMRPLIEGDWTGRRLTRFDDVRLLRRMLRDVRHRNHQPLATLLHWHYVRAGELFSIIPLKGLADHVLSGGMPFDLPVLKPFFSGEESIWPRREDLEQYASFLDARIRYERIERLLDSIEGLTLEQVNDLELIPGDAIVREFIGGSTVEIPHNE